MITELLSSYTNHRPLFTDGWNSIFHILFGILGAHFSIILPLFVGYQLMDIYDKNTWVDIGEFFIGYSCAIVFHQCVKL